MKKAVVLFSGGLDSTTCLAIAKSQGFTPFALSFNYHQRHRSELNAAKRITEAYGITHKIFEINIDQFKGSALTDQNIAIPDYNGEDKIPTTYVPARNTIFMSIALAWAEVIGSEDMFIGVNAIDYSGYPDCRPEFVEAFQKVANLATKAGVEGHKFKIHSPLISLSKAEIICLGSKLGIDYSTTVSCYQADAEGHACGKCDSCALRKKGFLEARIKDPTRYK